MSNSSEAGADATVDAGVICTEGSMRSELSMIVPTHICSGGVKVAFVYVLTDTWCCKTKQVSPVLCTRSKIPLLGALISVHSHFSTSRTRPQKKNLFNCFFFFFTLHSLIKRSTSQLFFNLIFTSAYDLSKNTPKTFYAQIHFC